MASRSRSGGRAGSGLLGLVVALVAVLLWWTQGDGSLQDLLPTDRERSAETQRAPTGGTDAESGLPWVAPQDLPPEAAQTLRLIERGGPFPYEEDDTVFGNREGILPDRAQGYYREYTVDTPGLDHRGARRIVGGSAGELYWTEDHYASFARIREAAS